MTPTIAGSGTPASGSPGPGTPGSGTPLVGAISGDEAPPGNGDGGRLGDDEGDRPGDPDAVEPVGGNGSPPGNGDDGPHRPGGGGGSEPPTPPPMGRQHPHRLHLRAIVAGVFTLLFVAFAVSAVVVPLPYYALRPGSVRATEPLLSVSGGTPTYPAAGSIGYTTVSLRQTTLVGLIEGWLNDDVDVHPEDEVLGAQNEDQNRAANLQLMDQSKEIATQVALERLGYHVTVSSSGSTVVDVQPASPASGKLEVGDSIVAVDGERIDSPDDLPRLMAEHGPGDEVTVTVEAFTSDARRDVTMTLAPSPDEPGKGIMGVRVLPRDVNYDFPIDVEIDTGNVGGPSAGLAFTLAILDDLTPGELTGGERVAVTGEIHPDGSVGAIGGTAQKAAAVRQAGIEAFIVPTADYEDALKRAGDVRVIPVDTLDDALDALADLGGNADNLPQVSAGAGARPSG